MKNYQTLLRSITSHLKESEKQFLFEVMKEELKKIRQEDITLKGEASPRPLTFINRDVFDLSTSKLRALDVIKDPIALESPLQALSYCINNISLDQNIFLAIRLLTRCFDSRTGEADLIVDKIDKILFKTTEHQYNASIISLFIEINYGGQTSKGLKHFKKEENLISELRRIYRKYNYRNHPIEDVNKINKQLLGIVNDELRRNKRNGNLIYITMLEQLKAEIQNIG